MSAIRFNDIPDDTKCVLSGYIRNMQKYIDNDIPEVIMMIILSFYYIAEYFKDTDCKGSENNTKIVSTGSNRNAYGNIHIDSTIPTVHHWKFKIGKVQYSGTYTIGIAEISVFKQRGIWMTTGKGYAYDGTGTSRIPSVKGYSFKWGGTARFKEGDILEMVLDLKNKILIYQVNDNKSESTLINNIKTGIDIEYKLAVMLSTSGDWIQLISYYQEQTDGNNRSEK